MLRSVSDRIDGEGPGRLCVGDRAGSARIVCFFLGSPSVVREDGSGGYSSEAAGQPHRSTVYYNYKFRP